MNIEKAKKLAYRDVVHYPEDRGEPAGSGTVQRDTSNMEVLTNIHKVEFVWVHIKKSDGNFATWPSNRLG